MMKLNARGETLVTVIVAFMVLMVACGMFYKAITLSTNMIDRAEELRSANEAALVHYYTVTATDDTPGEGTLTFKRGGADTDPGFTMPGELTSTEATDEAYGLEYFK